MSKEYNNLLERLTALIDERPEMSRILQEKFTEAIYKRPYMRSGSVFMRNGKPTSLYVLTMDEGLFKISNIRGGYNWSNYKEASNKCDFDKRDYFPYLTKFDFVALLKKSGVNIKGVYRVLDEDLDNLYKNISK